MTETLFEVKDAAVMAQNRPRRRKGQVATTPTGDNSSDILGGWINYMEQGSAVPIPKTVRSRMGRQIRELIEDGYDSPSIKRGLIVWTANWLDNPLRSPQTLTQLTWKAAMDATPQGRQFQEEYRAAMVRIAEVTNAVPQPTKEQQRTATNERGKGDWREQYAARKRREEGL